MQFGQGLEVGGDRQRWGPAQTHPEQPLRGQPLPARFQLRDDLRGGVLCPVLQSRQPARETPRLKLPPIPAVGGGRQLAGEPVQHPLGALGPPRLQLPVKAVLFSLDRIQDLGQRPVVITDGVGVKRILGQQAADLFEEVIDLRPDGQESVELIGRQRIALLSPVVLNRLGQERGLVGDQLLVEQAAAIEGVLAQHALAPGIDGVDGRLVHPLGGHGQPPGGLHPRRFIRVVRDQGAEEVVFRRGRGVAPEAAGRREEAGADAVGQFTGGRPGEGHHQDFGWHQGALEAVLPAVAEDQTQIERGDRPGLARPGGGLDQAAAPQGKLCGDQVLACRWRLGRHAAVTSLSGASSCGRVCT